MLTSSRITLRPLEPYDLEFLYRWDNETSLWQYSNTVAPLSRHLLSDYIDNYDADIFNARQLRLMIVENHDINNHSSALDQVTATSVNTKHHSTTIGMIDIYDLDIRNQRAFIGILIDQQFQGNGYAKEAINLVVNYARNTLGLVQLVAHVPIINQASISLFLSCEFSHSGTLKNWHRSGRKFLDIAVLQRLL